MEITLINHLIHLRYNINQHIKNRVENTFKGEILSSIVKQINMAENKTLEFKESLPKNDSIAKTAVAFSNTSGGKMMKTSMIFKIKQPQ